MKVGERGMEEEIIKLKHSYNKHQIMWFYAGSALNVLKSRNKPSTK
jgi:hypothetical protein